MTQHGLLSLLLLAGGSISVPTCCSQSEELGPGQWPATSTLEAVTTPGKPISLYLDSQVDVKLAGTSCPILPHNIKATANGTPMDILSLGGDTGGAWECKPGEFTIANVDGGDVTFAISDSSGEMGFQAVRYLETRTVALVSPVDGGVRVGDEVQVHWVPGTDDFSELEVSAKLSDGGTILPSDVTSVPQQGLLSFHLPEMAPGPVVIEVNGVAPRANFGAVSTSVKDCHGVKSCRAIVYATPDFSGLHLQVIP